MRIFALAILALTAAAPAQPNSRPDYAAQRLNASLLRAAQACDAAKVAQALDAGADPNAADREHASALLLALRAPEASDADRLNTARTLLDHAANAQTPDAAGKTPLLAAARRADDALISLLLEHNAGIDAPDPDGRTCLMLVAQVRWGTPPDHALASIKLLLAHHAGVNARDAQGQTPLFHAVAHHLNESGGVQAHAQVVSALLDAGADPDAQDAEGRTALLSALATWHGPPQVIQALLDHNANPNLSDRRGWTPLMEAARQGKPDELRMLLAHHADAGATNPDHDTALRAAVEAGNAQTAALLLDSGADPHAAGYDSKESIPAAARNFALLNAAGRADNEAVTALLDQGAPVNFRDRAGRTALLHAAASYSDAQSTISLLLGRSADVNAQDSAADTALTVAAARHQIDSLALLLDHGASIDARNAAGRTALLNAADNDDPRAVALMLEHHADPSVRDASGKTGVALAAPHHLSTQVLGAFLGAGVDPNLPDTDGRTPLMLAAQAASLDAVQVLLVHHADPTARDKAGATALDLAQRARQQPDLPPADADNLDAIRSALGEQGLNDRRQNPPRGRGRPHRGG